MLANILINVCIIQIKVVSLHQKSIIITPKSRKGTKIMKAIQIRFESVEVTKFSAIAHENEKFCWCEVTEKAANYIKAQSIDGQVYESQQDEEPCNSIYCYKNGDPHRYYIKGEVYDENDPFAPAKEGEWEWQAVELRVIDIMD